MHSGQLPPLVSGPRVISEATRDFMSIAEACLSDQAFNWYLNPLNEVEVEAWGKKYNLTKILEHHPDFESMDFDFSAAERSAANKMMSGYLEGRMTDEQGIEYNMRVLIAKFAGCEQAFEKKNAAVCKRVNMAYRLHFPLNQPVMPVEERMALAIYTSDNGVYQYMNKFLRKHGRLKDNEEYDVPTLRELICLITFTVQAIKKIKRNYWACYDAAEHLTANRQQASDAENLYRSESYEKSSRFNRVMRQRLSHSYVYESGFYSTSREKNVAVETFKGRKDDKGKLIVNLMHMINSLGIYVADYSSSGSEEEVLFMPGMQIMYKKHQQNELTAIPVRSVNGHEAANYNGELLELRRKLMMTVTVENQMQLSKLLMKLVHALVRAEVGAMAKSILICAEMDASLSALSLQDANLKSRCDYYLNIVKSIAKKIRECVALQYVPAQEGDDFIRAANAAYELHLAKPMRETHLCDDDVSLNFMGVELHRPNHGLAHSVRIAMFLPVIVAALGDYARDEQFRRFLRGMSEVHLTIFKAAAVFSVTGRESEVSFGADPENHFKYRRISAQNFVGYATSQGWLQDESKRDFIYMLAEQIQHRCDPDYLKKSNNYFQVVLTLAHMLDLMRTYNKNSFEQDIDDFLASIAHLITREFKVRGLPILLKMALQSLIATGDRVMTSCKNGVLVDCRTSYNEERFLACSTNAHVCMLNLYCEVPVFSILEQTLQVADNADQMSEIQAALLNNDKEAITEWYENYAYASGQVSEFIYMLADHVVTGKRSITDVLRFINWDDVTEFDLSVALHAAARGGEHLWFLLNGYKIKDKNILNDEGESALYVAASCGHKDLVCMLTLSGSSLEHKASSGMTPLDHVVKDADMVTLLLTQSRIHNVYDEMLEKILVSASWNIVDHIAKVFGVDLEKVSVNNFPFLHYVAARKKITHFSGMIERGSKPFNTISDQKNSFQVFTAAFGAQFKPVEKMLADENAVDWDAILRLLMDVATSNVNLQIRSAAIQQINFYIQLNKIKKISLAPEVAAAATAFTLSTQEYIAIMRPEDGPYELTAYYEIQTNQYELIPYFLASSRIDVNVSIDNNGNTLLHAAVNARHHQCVGDLLSFGANPNQVNNYGKSAYDLVTELFYAASIDTSERYKLVSTFLVFYEKMSRQSSVSISPSDINKVIDKMLSLFVTNHSSCVNAFQALSNMIDNNKISISPDYAFILRLITQNIQCTYVDAVLRALITSSVTIVHLIQAVRSCQLPLLSYLIKKYHSLINQVDHNGQGLICVALVEDRIGVAELLLSTPECNPNVMMPDNLPILHYALRNDLKRIFILLMRHSKINLLVADKKGQSILAEVLSILDHEPFYAMQLLAGAQIDLEQALESCSNEIVNKMLEFTRSTKNKYLEQRVLRYIDSRATANACVESLFKRHKPDDAPVSDNAHDKVFKH